jgi:hypothetical protein
MCGDPAAEADGEAAGPEDVDAASIATRVHPAGVGDMGIGKIKGRNVNHEGKSRNDFMSG